MYMYHEHENLYNKLGGGEGGGWKGNKELKVKNKF